MPLDNTSGPVSQALLGPSVGTSVSPAATKAPAIIPTVSQISAMPAPGAAPSAAPAAAQAPPTPQPPPSSGDNQVQTETLSNLADSLRQSMDDLQEEEAEPGPNPPPAPYLPPPPTTPPQNPLHAWGSMAMILATMGSLLTRRPLTTALNAGASVMNAYTQKNQAAANNAQEIWKAETANALNLEKYQMDQYNKALTDRNMDIREKIATVQASAAAFKDAPTIAALETGGLPAVIALQKKRGGVAAKLADTSFDLDVSHQAGQVADAPDQSGYSKNQWLQIAQNVQGGGKFKFATGALGNLQKEEFNKATLQVTAGIPGGGGVGGVMSNNTINALAKAWTNGVPLSQLTAGLSGDSTKIRVDIENAGVNLLIAQGKDPTSFITAQTDYKANQETLDQMTKSANSAASYEKTTLDNMATAQSLQAQGIPTNISPILNQIAAFGEVKTGSPATLAYGAALTTTLTEYAKVMAGGTGSSAASSDSARQEAADLISQFGTAAQANAVFSVMRQDMNNRITEYANSIAAINKAISTGQSSTGMDIAPPPPSYTPSPTTQDESAGGAGWSIQAVQ